MSSLLQLKRSRSPARPGPGPMPDPLLRALDLKVSRRIDGLLAGDFPATLLGRGTELAQVRPYVPGDDVRDIDWNVTARTREPHVRVHIAEKVLTTWLLLDVSASMSFGTAERRKADVAEGVALAVGYLATRRGNRLGLMNFGGPAPRMLAPSQGRAGMLGLLTTLRHDAASEGGGVTSLGKVLKRANSMFRSRSAVFLVSDLRGPRDWRKPLIQLAGRHDVLVVEIGDPREQELPDVGEIRLVDPETGKQVAVNTRTRSLRERFAQAAEQERTEVARAVASTGAAHVVLSTAGDWLSTFATFLASRGERR